jgi:hypothetical protein
VGPCYESMLERRRQEDPEQSCESAELDDPIGDRSSPVPASGARSHRPADLCLPGGRNEPSVFSGQTWGSEV